MILLETAVLSSEELLGSIGGGRMFIHSSHSGGIHLVIVAEPLFKGYYKIVTEFPKVASITYYLPYIASRGHYTGIWE